MPADAYDDAIDLQIGLLVADLPSVASYPFPTLRLTGEQEMRRFRTIVLQNNFLFVTIIPALGGRILSILDKRTGKDIFPKAAVLMPMPSGNRGVQLSEGLQIRLGLEDRLNAMGNVDSALLRPQDDDSAAGVWIAETVSGTGLSWHCHIWLPANSAELNFEMRVLNRSRQPVGYQGGIAIGAQSGVLQGNTFYDSPRDAGFTVHTSLPPFNQGELKEGRISFLRSLSANTLGPRQVDSWTLKLVPWSGLGEFPLTGKHAAMTIDKEAITLQTSTTFLGAKLIIQTQDERVLETSLDLYPENLASIPLGELSNRISAAVVQDAGKNVLVRSDFETSASEVDPAWLRTMEAGTRHLSYLELAERDVASGNFASADQKLEQVLLYNGDDPLTWWLKALIARLQGSDEETAPELLNAHYLAPLEPALRAEAFLAQSQEMGKEANPLLVGLAENPENFIEVAALLVEIRRWDQASRWIDEALRHKDFPMLRYLWAYVYLQGSRMEAEAAEQMNAAAKLEFGPPFPFRAVELSALSSLSARFPLDFRLNQFLEVLSQAGRGDSRDIS